MRRWLCRLQSGFTISYEKTTLYRIGSLRFSSAQLYELSEIAWTNQDISVLGVQIAHEDIVQKNYAPLVEKTRQIFGSWFNRGLSLIGKVQVVNTLVASLFVYKMMVLPTIPKKIIKNIDNQIRQFIWNGKKSKIAYNVLQSTKKDGGLNLVNLLNKDKSLKATWPQILIKEEEYAQLVFKILKCNDLKHNIWRCNISVRDVKLLGIKSQFWEDVLCSWAEFNYGKNFRIENQIIWYNSEIKIKSKVVLWSDILRRGLLFVYQLFEDGTFKSDKQVWQEFGLSVLRYNSIKTALPVEWKRFFSQQHLYSFLPTPPHNFDYFANTKSLASRVYKTLMENTNLLQNKYLKWISELGQDFCEDVDQFKAMHCEIYRTTNVPRLRSFQYRILQRAVVTNKHLNLWGLRNSSNCYYCGNYIESMVHLFCLCSCVQKLWYDLRVYIQQNFQDISLSLEPFNIIKNRITPNQRHVVNFWCLITKQYIYSQRCLSGQIGIAGLKARIRSIEMTERFIASKNGRLSKHYAKWRARPDSGSMCVDNYAVAYISAL